MDIKGKIAKLIKIDGVSARDIETLLTDTALEGAGDVSLPCFKLSGLLKKPPALIAAEIKNALSAPPAFIDKTETAGGYLNFYLNRKSFGADTLKNALKPDYGKSNAGRGKTVLLDYSSVNIAKDFHIGHLATTAIGAALYRVYKKLGYNAVGINHLGDYGTQFGKQIVAYKKWGDKKTADAGGVAELQRLYAKFHAEAETHPELEDEARAAFKAIEDGDAEAVGLFKRFTEITLKEVFLIYDRLGVSFDSILGESFYSDQIPAALAEIKKSGITEISDGALIVDLEKYGMPPCLLQKSDGTSLYATRDIAAALYRYKTYNFAKCLYVVASHQNLHFKQFFKVLDLSGHTWSKDLEHVAYGMVSLEDGAMSTRKGNVVLLKDCLDRARDKAKQIMKDKGAELPDLDGAAEAVGVSAVVFSALINTRVKDVVFSYDKMLNFDGETAPYLMYTAARANSVLQKAGSFTPTLSAREVNDEEYALLKLLAKYPETLSSVLAESEPSHLTRHLVAIAKAYNKFYFEHRILNADAPARPFRLTLTAAVLNVLKDGFNLLGLKYLPKM